jgi:hypothetical protein
MGIATRILFREDIQSFTSYHKQGCAMTRVLGICLLWLEIFTCCLWPEIRLLGFLFEDKGNSKSSILSLEGSSVLR